MISQLIANNEVWYIEPGFLQGLLEMANSKELSSIDETRMGSLFDLINTSNTYERKNDIAIIPISGPLVKKANPILQFLLGVSSYEQIEANFRKTLEDDKIKGIMLRVDSPGGLVTGLASLSDIIFSSRGKKPILAYVENATSAAYWLASSADAIVLSEPTAKTGSIGCVAVHRSVQKAAEKLGLEFAVIASGSYKKIGNEYEQLSKTDREYFQDRINYFHDLFIQAVSRNLGKPVDKLPKDVVESKVFIGQEGISAGLASEILSFDDALAKLRSMASNTNLSKSRSSANSGSETMKYQNYGLKEILMEIQSCDDIDKLSQIERELIQEASRREAKSENWVETQQAGNLKNDISKLASERRRQLLAMSTDQSNRDSFALGQAVARAIFGSK